MELSEAMRTQNACRYYRDEPVPDEVLYNAVELGPGLHRQVRRLAQCAAVKDSGRNGRKTARDRARAE